MLSVQKIVRRGNIMKMRKGGGYIENMSSGKRLPFVEGQGVYLIKLEILHPSSGDADPDADSARQWSIRHRHGRED